MVMLSKVRQSRFKVVKMKLRQLDMATSKSLSNYGNWRVKFERNSETMNGLKMNDRQKCLPISWLLGLPPSFH